MREKQRSSSVNTSHEAYLIPRSLPLRQPPHDCLIPGLLWVVTAPCSVPGVPARSFNIPLQLPMPL